VALLNELMKHGVRVIVCGQSAAANGVTNNMVIDGVEIALSAMTAHAQLSMNGYTTNPF
jgi:intracellular sulfur oxidation DsrE/DsrF family protein